MIEILLITKSFEILEQTYLLSVGNRNIGDSYAIDHRQFDSLSVSTERLEISEAIYVLL